MKTDKAAEARQRLREQLGGQLARFTSGESKSSSVPESDNTHQTNTTSETLDNSIIELMLETSDTPKMQNILDSIAIPKSEDSIQLLLTRETSVQKNDSETKNPATPVSASTNEMSTSGTRDTRDFSSHDSRVLPENVMLEYGTSFENEDTRVLRVPTLSQADKTEGTSETRDDKALETPETRVGKKQKQYGEKVPRELFFPVLDIGFYDLAVGSTATSALIFYWAFTTQQTSILHVPYSAIRAALDLKDSRIVRAMDRFRHSNLIQLKQTPEGTFLDLSKLIETAKREYQEVLQRGTADGTSETLAAVVSSKSLNSLKELQGTATFETRVRKTWESISQNDFRILVDLMAHFGFTKRDISPKLMETMAVFHKEKGLRAIAYNLAYVSLRKTTSNRMAYLLKTLGEDYGGTSLSYEDREKTDRFFTAFTTLRTNNVEDIGTTDLRGILQLCGKYMPNSAVRLDYEEAIREILKKSEEIHKVFSDIAGRGEKLKISGPRERL